MRILIVDDSPGSLQSLQVVLSDLGHAPLALSSPVEALDILERGSFPMVITDIRMPEMSGLELLERIKSTPGTELTDVVIITGHGDMETAIQALRKGAYDYLNKPINARELAAVVERCAEHQALLHENLDFRERFDDRVKQATQDIRKDLDKIRNQLREVHGIGNIVAESEAMARIVAETRIYHDDPEVPVLIEGETGTGKEVVARLIHFGERGTDTPLVALNCSAISANLFESELFGHEAGAYTGSTRKGARGKLELASQGTLFLDEIAEMPLDLQPKLLRVLEDKTFYRVGGLKKRDYKARTICAANRDLAGMVDKGVFRRDLFHRLKVGHIVIPPLRERAADIPHLAELFLLRQSERKKKEFRSISDSALALLTRYPWPGNVRELENIIERAVLTNNGTVLQAEHLDFPSDTAVSDASRRARPDVPSVTDLRAMPLPEDGLNLAEFTSTLIREVLKRFDGNKTQAADYLGMSRYALHRRLQKDSE